MCIAAIVGDSIHPRRSLTSHYPHCVGTRQLGALPQADAIQNLGLSVFPTGGGDKQLESGVGPLASIIPLLKSLPLGGDSREKGDTKPSRYLVAKGLPTLPMKLVDRIWNLEYVDMEEFLPAPRSLRLAEQGKPAPSLQESLVQPVSGNPESEDSATSPGCHNLDEVLHPIHRRDGQAAVRHGSVYGGSPSHRLEVTSKSSQKCSVAGV